MMTNGGGSVRPLAESGGDAMLWEEGGSVRHRLSEVGVSSDAGRVSWFSYKYVYTGY